MINKKITLTLLTCLCLILSVNFPVLAEEQPAGTGEEEFQPVISFHGNISVTADSYSGIKPISIGDVSQKEQSDVEKMFGLTDPTPVKFIQNITLQFYGNPVPDLELFLNLGHKSAFWGGDKYTSLAAPLMVEEAYARYYTDYAMVTAGRFDYDLDLFGLLLAKGGNTRDGFTVHTMAKDVWLTLAYNRLYGEVFPTKPYMAVATLDDLVAFRASKKFGNQLVGINIIPDSFFDEQMISIDQSGKIFGKNVKSELAATRLDWTKRYNEVLIDNPDEPEAEPQRKQVSDPDFGVDRLWLGGMISINAIENYENLLTVRVGAMDKGFIPFYGARGQIETEGQVKFDPNTYGISFAYQRALSETSELFVDLTLRDIIDKEYATRKKEYPTTRYAEVKWRKYLSPVLDMSVSVNHIHGGPYTYSRAALEWNARF